jgi:hypothetical protein
MTAHGHGSTPQYIKLHRSKYACLNKNIISPALKTDLIDDFQNRKYAIMLNESTDMSTQKRLCMLVEIVTGFIGLMPVQEATGGKKFNLIDEETERCGQSVANRIGFAMEGASNMVRGNNSVWSRLTAASPFCVQHKCILSLTDPLHSICSTKTTIKYCTLTVRHTQLVLS